MRPKSFWRRNWYALSLIVILLVSSAMDTLMITDSGFAMAVSKGHIVVGKTREIETSLERSDTNHHFRWAKPKLGMLPMWFDEKRETGLATPIWLPLVLLAGWITFREVRLRRARKN